jgi:hypothetical protein
VLTVLALLASVFMVATLSYLGGREKEKRDVLMLLKNQPSVYAEAIVRIIKHEHRQIGKRSHYDERRRH